MRTRIILSFILVCFSLVSVAQGNICTIMGNGGFETPGSDDDVYENLPANQHSGWQLERVSTYSYNGSYSLKCTYPTTQNNNLVFLSKELGFFVPGRDYSVSAMIYVPSTSGLNEDAIVIPGVCSNNNYFIPSAGFCSTQDNKILEIESDDYGKWIQIYTKLDHDYTDNSHAIQFFLLVSNQNSTGTFYLDNIEIYEEIKPSPEFAITPDEPIKGNPVTITATNLHPLNGYSYWYGFGDGTFNPIGSTQETHTYQNAGDYNVQLAITSIGCPYWFNIPIHVKDVAPLCETIIPLASTGEIKLDKFSGRYVFQRNVNCAQDISLGCIRGKVDLPQFKDVVSASATTFSDGWEQTMTGVAFERGAQGKWRPQATYAYNKGAVSVDKNLNSGKFQLSYFNWQYPEATKKAGWLKVNEITKYSPHGDAIEERNALDIMSAAKFGYTNTVPYMIAQNADYNSILFESFENTYGSLLEDGMELSGGTLDAGEQHSGKYSLKLDGQFVSRTFLRGNLDDRGILVRLWAKVSETAPFELMLSAPGHSLPTAGFTSIARSGEWSLWEARIPPDGFSLQTEESIFTIRINKLAVGDVWIDDVRIQPLDAEATCYVYDVNTLKLLASFDDQHFALFYQYNAEGKLVRKMIETERGIKTVQETQYNTPEVNKSSFVGQ